MSGNIKVGGSWRSLVPYVKAGGTWRYAKKAYVKKNGTWQNWHLAGGLNDETFNTADQKNNFSEAVVALAAQSDGKILVGGDFTYYNGVKLNGLGRFNADGTPDTTFNNNIGTGANSTVYSIVVQSDGKILVGGNFSTFAGVSTSRLIRLNSDGTRDSSFGPPTFDGSIQDIAIQSTGAIIVVGGFTTVGETSVGYYARLNSNGTYDATFNQSSTGANSAISAVIKQSDDKVVLTGSFTSINGTTGINRVVRLNSTGARDTTFSTGTGANGSVSDVAIQSDGKIILVGNFTFFNGTSVGRIVRLSTLGAIDSTLGYPYTIGTVRCVHVRSDGKIVLGGDFASGVNDATGTRIVCMNADGTANTGFNSNIGSGASNTVYAIVESAGGKTVVGGSFKTFNNKAVNSIAVLNSDGTATTDFATVGTMVGYIYSAAVQTDNKILIGGSFNVYRGQSVPQGIARLERDGSVDSNFATNIGSGMEASGRANSVATYSDGKIVIGGTFQTFNGVTLNGLGRIYRLNSDGTTDTTFAANVPGFGNTINDVAVQSDGKTVVVGAFTSPSRRIARLNANGTTDSAFATSIGLASDAEINSVAVQSDGKIVIGGFLIKWGSNSVQTGLIRLNSDGTQDTSFYNTIQSGANGNINCVAVQSDGKILLGGSFTMFNGSARNGLFRLNADGTTDIGFYANIGSAADSVVYDIAVQSDGKILLCGLFSTFNSFAANGIVRLNSDGSIDSGFVTNIGTGLKGAFQIAQQNNGKAVLVGEFPSLNGVVRSGIARIGTAQAN